MIGLRASKKSLIGVLKNGGGGGDIGNNSEYGELSYSCNKSSENGNFKKRNKKDNTNSRETPQL